MTADDARRQRHLWQLDLRLDRFSCSDEHRSRTACTGRGFDGDQRDIVTRSTVDEEATDCEKPDQKDWSGNVADTRQVTSGSCLTLTSPEQCEYTACKREHGR
ncbi:hypothetical protein [Halospeciosus flavus]|uniref:hypothetical protein n=1 Tax=Halospeciosus flavus TaxID=3032283 RepID=UPI003618CD44